MATESQDGTDVSVTLPQELEEWLDERAGALDVDRDELLVQLASAYRAAADFEADPLARLVDDALDDNALVDVEARLSAEGSDLDDLEDRVDGLESELAENVEDLRNRVLQLRDAVGDTAPENHTHREFSQFDGRIDDLSEGVDDVASDVEALADRVDAVESQLADADEKLTRVARAVVALRKNADGDASEAPKLDEIRLAANRAGVSAAACGACESPVTVGLLTESTCPHCETDFEGLELPEPGLGRTLGFRKPRLRCAEPPALEAGDE